jgi:hypothetical protein
MAHTSAREDRLARLLHDCVCALDALLASPDLNLDSLERETRDAIDVAHAVVHAVKAGLDEPVDMSTIPSAGKPRCKLVGTDGNVFALMGRVRSVLMQYGLKDQAREMAERITTQAGDYHHALAIMMEYVDVS